MAVAKNLVGIVSIQTVHKDRQLIAYWVIFHDFLSSVFFFKINFLKKFVEEYHQNVKQFGS